MFTMRNKTLYCKLPVHGGKFTIEYKVNLPEIIDQSLLYDTSILHMIIYVWVFPSTCPCSVPNYWLMTIVLHVYFTSKQVTKTADLTTKLQYYNSIRCVFHN